MIEGEKSILTPRERIRLGDAVRLPNGQMAVRVKSSKRSDKFDTITPIDICRELYGEDAEYSIIRRTKAGMEIVQQDIPRLRQTQVESVKLDTCTKKMR